MPSNPQSPPANHADEPDALDYLSIGLGWLIPGAGHVAIGQTARGLLFALIIHGLFAAGLFVGGVRSINPPDQAIWSYTQFMAGWPMILSNYVQKQYAPEIQAVEADAKEIPVQDVAARRKFLQEHPLLAYSPELKDVGAVYCGIAGMLNLLVMFDVLVRFFWRARGGYCGKSDARPGGWRRAMMALLGPAAVAFTPFVDSVQALWPNASAYWMWLLAPLVVAISVVYRGTKVQRLADLPRSAAWLAVQIVVVMVVAAAALYGIHYFFIRAV